jgi:hypothetical protein
LGSERDGHTANADAALKQRFNQETSNGTCAVHTTIPLEQETVLVLQVLPDPTPTMLMGLQSNPRSTFRSDKLMPRSPRSAEPAAELALDSKPYVSNLFSHSRTVELTGSVLSQQAVVGEPVRATLAADVATARRGRARNATRENILDKLLND